MELYKTIRKQVCETQVIEKSKFIAHARPVESKEEADAFVAEIKAQYKDATHNVPAMIIGNNGQIQWASDDGEPQGTSGPPMLQYLASQGLTNIVVVVTRYFGGTKLGTGGLVRAYSSSAKMAIESAGICSVMEVCRIKAIIDYTHLAKVQKAAADNLQNDNQGFVVAGIDYEEKVVLELIAAQENQERVLGVLANITSGTAEIVSQEKSLEKV